MSDRGETAKRPEQMPGTRGKGPAADPLVTEGTPDLTSRFSDPQPQPGRPSPSPRAFALSQPLGVWKDILGIWKICKSI